MFTFIAFNKMRFFVWSFVRLFAGFGALFFSPRHSMESKEQQKKRVKKLEKIVELNRISGCLGLPYVCSA